MTVNFAGMNSIVAPHKPSIPPLSDGGIIESKEDKPIPGACEERPTTIDPRTGERIYLDQLIKPGVCYLA
jgi:hypothetical protein